jgi:ribosomal protein L29
MAEIKDKKIDELMKDLYEKREALRVVKSNGNAKDKNVKAQSVLKKDIARILTAINAKK